MKQSIQHLNFSLSSFVSLEEKRMEVNMAAERPKKVLDMAEF